MTVLSHMTAAQLVEHVRRNGGRVFRQGEERVFCLTSNRTLVEELVALGAVPYSGTTLDGYVVSTDAEKREFDLYLNDIDVIGPQTIWEAAG
jgi:hypothetical protein